MDPIYLRAQSLICAQGTQLPEIIDSIRLGNAPTEIKTIIQAGETVKRSVFSIKNNAEELPSKRLALVLSDTIKQVIKRSGLSLKALQHIPIIIGSAYLEVPAQEYKFYNKYFQELYQLNIIENALRSIGLLGDVLTFSTACTSSINALNCGVDMIKAGFTDRVLSIGVETFSLLSFWGLEGFGILSPNNCFRPFDKARSGFLMGEGCGALLLDKEAGATDDFHYLGSASLCDTHNIAGNEPNGVIMEAVMREAIQQSKLRTADISAIKAHGAASPVSDLAEIRAIKRIFGANTPPFTSVKPYVGHTLGGSGLVELIVVTEAIKKSFLPKTLNYKCPEDTVDIEPLKENLSLSQGNILLNYFGFGGGCTSAVVSNLKD